MTTLSAVQVRSMREADIKYVIALMEKDPEVAFCKWENESLFRRELDNDCSVLLVAVIDSQIVGALIGGNFARRGMICHTDVDSRFRSHGIGGKLVEHCLEVFRSRGIRRVHLMLTPGNPRAEHFWEMHGFSRDDSHEFLEFDVAEDFASELETDSSDIIEITSLDQLAGCAQLIARDEWQEEEVLECTCRQSHGLLLRASLENRTALFAGGRYGFRAEVSHLHAEDPRDSMTLLVQACSLFAQAGTRRIHVQIPANDQEIKNSLIEFGFHSNEGEKLYHCKLA